MVPLDVIVSDGNAVNVLGIQTPPSRNSSRMLGRCPMATISCTTSGRSPST